jgi:hypothetical protein
VTVEPYPVASSAVAPCQQLVASLPGHLLDQGRRDLTADQGSEQVAAVWGDPVITLRCGWQVSDIDTWDPTVLTVNGVAWHWRELTGGYEFYWTDGRISVDVSVPAAYAPQTNVLTELAPHISALATL